MAMQPSVGRVPSEWSGVRDGKVIYPFLSNADARMVLEVIGSAVDVRHIVS